MRWTKSLRGTKLKSYGLKWLLPFLLAFSLFSASLLSAQAQSSQVPPTTPSDQYSKMTPEQLRQAIADKDKLLSEWITRGLQWIRDKQQFQTDLTNLQATSTKQTATIKDLTTSLDAQDKASQDQLASRDRLIQDQATVIKERTQERDDARAELGRQKAEGWLEKLLYAFGGLGLGYTAGHFTK